MFNVVYCMRQDLWTFGASTDEGQCPIGSISTCSLTSPPFGNAVYAYNTNTNVVTIVATSEQEFQIMSFIQQYSTTFV